MFQNGASVSRSCLAAGTNVCGARKLTTFCVDLANSDMLAIISCVSTRIDECPVLFIGRLGIWWHMSIVRDVPSKAHEVLLSFCLTVMRPSIETL